MTFPTLEGWTPRDVPLEPLAVAARGVGAYALARRLLDRSDDELRRLRGAASGVSSEVVLVVGGAFDLLPWAPDAVYLGSESSAPALLWPVHAQPPFAPDLMERALRRRFPALAAPLVLVPQWKLVASLGSALPLQRPFVGQFLAREIA